ncbi:MAG TPA: hypothetical protein VKZ18_29430 [Polyangia bacterium]|nr:hypothetical protein [Polyangia bacterium]
MRALARRWASGAVDRVLLGVRRIPQFAIVGLPVPQRDVEVILETPRTEIDVTTNNVAVSLQPLRLGIGVRAPSPSEEMALAFRARADRRLLARLRLRYERSLGDGGAPGGRRLAIFRPVAGDDACVGRLRRSVYYGWKRWSARRPPSPVGPFSDFKNLLSFYICPRPVALVSVMEADGHGNLFPMDLMGPTATPFFVAALKNASRSTALVQRARRMVVSRIPLALSAQAYALAAQHRVWHADWKALALPLMPSPAFGFPVPAQALTVTELEVREWQVMGSHTALLSLPVHEEVVSPGEGMHHVSGLYQEHLRARGASEARPG